MARPVFPAPSDLSEGETSMAKLARMARRDREAVAARNAAAFTSPRLRGDLAVITREGG
jgi:hypothetical protein